MDIFKIGQEFIAKENLHGETLSGRKIEISEGDKGFVDSKGAIHFYTGLGKGFITAKEVDVQGYDKENIAKMIFKRLNAMYTIDNLLEYEGITREDFIESIEEVLHDIL